MQSNCDVINFMNKLIEILTKPNMGAGREGPVSLLEIKVSLAKFSLPLIILGHKK